MDAGRAYLLLGLRLGRHVDGLVDAYFGPPELAAQVGAEDVAEPRALVAAAEELLDELDDGWLRDQVVGLDTSARVLAGEPIPYAEEVERCYGVRPAWTDESVFAAAHQRLAELLPGHGDVGERYRSWRDSLRVAPDRVETAVAAAIDAARAWARDLVELPDGEGVSLETVRDVPWLAFCEYRGALQSEISVNVDLPISAFDLLQLTLHETYPGHHAERCLKDEALVRGRALLEESIVLVPTPQSLVSEGIAELAPWLVLESEGGAAFVRVLADARVELDLAHALAVERAREPCGWAAVNAALLLHERGAPAAEVQAYLERWELAGSDLAAHAVRFLRDPTSRTYVTNYVAGRELCAAYVDGEPARFRRLLTEQVRVGELLAAAPS